MSCPLERGQGEDADSAADRIVITARAHTAKYRDGSGILREVPTGCRDVKRFTRLSLGFSKKLENLVAAVSILTA